MTPDANPGRDLKVKLLHFEYTPPIVTERLALLFILPGRIAAPALEASLGNLLQLYPTAAGRLQREGDGVCIFCSGAGVPVTVLEAPEVDWDAVQQQDINIAAMRRGRDALMKVQITHCGTSHTLLGVTVAHVLADVAGIVLMLTSWVRLHRGETVKAPCFSRDIFRPPTPDKAKSCIANEVPQPSPRLHCPSLDMKRQIYRPKRSVAQLGATARGFLTFGLQLCTQGALCRMETVVLHIPPTSLARLKAQINALQPAGSEPLSANDVLTSLLRHAVRQVRGLPYDQDTLGSRWVGLLFNMRQVHVPADYFGNGSIVLYVPGQPKATARAPHSATLSNKHCCVSHSSYLQHGTIDHAEEVLRAVASTACDIRQAVVAARRPEVLAQMAGLLLSHGSASRTTRLRSRLMEVATYDAHLASWDDLYRAVGQLDFGMGAATHLLCQKLADDIEPWTGWWGRHAQSGDAYLHVMVPPVKVRAFRRCPVWKSMLPGAQFL
ncbi:hypothetical protein WJX72_003316 [[Myrmecia] bisecta]|uniref:Uncharacterized protein n=1 Tax=[Myrmecia] bisecta TaxID=41462 RepID=A0AAW1PSF6_9CHLO